MPNAAGFDQVIQLHIEAPKSDVAAAPTSATGCPPPEVLAPFQADYTPRQWGDTVPPVRGPGKGHPDPRQP